MKKKWFSQLIVALLVISMVISIVGCKAAEPVDTDTPDGTPVVTAPEETETPATYTYNVAMGASPVKWNPHTWETNADDSLTPYIWTPLIDVSIADDGVNYEWVYEGATAITDITATFADRDAWGITNTENQVYQIDLNPAVCWQDGSPINADSYIYSMQ